MLIVDDSETFVSSVEQWAADREDLLVVGRARTGAEALDACTRLRPDLVLLDLVLPGIDGFRVLRLLREEPLSPYVVIVTFYSSETARAVALAAGADAFLSKDEFAEGFERLLDELSGRRADDHRRVIPPSTRTLRGPRTTPEP